MARIVILTHEFDDFERRPYLVQALMPHWVEAGHSVQVVEGLEGWPEADIAVMHVDHSLVPEAYAIASRRYPRVINGQALDIRKRHVSRMVLTRDADWSGPVIVKTNLNHGGLPEMHYYARLRQAGRPGAEPPGDLAFSRTPYAILPDKSRVHPSFWDHPGVVVEPFMPEQDERGYWMRVWLFLGRQERSARYVATDPLVKGANITGRAECDVPDEIRAERERLGFDFGKFDFVVHQGRPILLDANRTPANPSPSLRPGMAEANARLATGLDDWVRAA